MRTIWIVLAALALTPVMAQRGIVETNLSRNPRERGGLGSSVEQAWPAYQGLVRSGIVTNDLLALAGRNLNGQDATTIAAYRDLWIQEADTMVAKTPAEAGVEVVTIVVRGDGGQLIPREVTEAGEIPLPIFGMTWGSSVTQGLVAFRRPGTYRAFAKNLVIRASKADRGRALRLLTWWDCGNSSITLPTPTVVERRVEIPGKTRWKTKIETRDKPVPGPCLVIEVPGKTERVEIPVPGPERCITRVEFVDRVREIRLQTPPLPTQRVEITPVILADSRRQVSGPGQYTPPAGVVTPGPGWVAQAVLTHWSQPAATKPPPTGNNPCPPPVTPPNPGTLPPGTPGGTTPPPGDTTLPPDPGGVPPVSGADGAVNTPPASNPGDYPPGSVVVPIASPGSAADNAANLLPG